MSPFWSIDLDGVDAGLIRANMTNTGVTSTWASIGFNDRHDTDNVEYFKVTIENTILKDIGIYVGEDAEVDLLEHLNEE